MLFFQTKAPKNIGTAKLRLITMYGQSRFYFYFIDQEIDVYKCYGNKP